MLTWAAAGVAVVFGTWMVWQRRWISDDGFINYRIIQQLLAGRGPTYNAAERVEGGTSTLWLGLVWLGQAITPGSDTGAVMVALGTALSALALALLAVGAFALHPGRPLLLPVGLAVVVAIAPMWDFGTSGLETSLSMAWIAACFAGLAVRVRRGPAARPAWQPWPLAVLIGLGPLVRPDFALLSLGFGIALLWQSGRRWRAWLAAAGIALVVPVAYEIFRMGFFASLVPNTALAKSNGSWAQGLLYLRDFVGTYWLWIPIAIGVWLIGSRVSRRPASGEPDARSLLVILPLTALAHTAFVVSVGGDFMHGRFLLPATFLFFAPIALVPATGHRRILVALVAVGAVSSALLLRPQLWNGMIADERSYYSSFVPDAPGASVPLENWSADVGFQLSRKAAADQARGESYYVAVGQPDQPLPRNGTGVAFLATSLGIAGAASGIEVTVADTPALVDPIGSRVVLPADAEFRVGHAYRPEVWVVARLASGDRTPPLAGLADARTALSCAPVVELMDAVSQPLTPERFFTNLMLAPKLTFLRIPVDPAEAVARLC